MNRTSDPQIFSPLLLPTELHDHGGELEIRTLETLPAPACFQDKCHRPARPTLQVCGVAYSAAMVVFGTTMKATAYRRGNKHWRDNPVPTRILIIYKYVPLSRRTQFPTGYLSHVGYLCRDLNPHRSIISQLPYQLCYTGIPILKHIRVLFKVRYDTVKKFIQPSKLLLIIELTIRTHIIITENITNRSNHRLDFINV